VAIETREQSKMNVKIYPNPSDGLVTLEMPTTPVSENCLITIYSLSGTLAYQLEYSNTNSPIHLDLTSLRAGNYIISVTSGEGNFSSKIVLQ